MKYYFLGLGTLVVVCVGCAIDGQKFLDRGEYHAPPAAMMQRPGPMVDGPGPGVMPMMQQAGFQQAGFGQPGFPQAGNPQPGFPQPGFPQSGVHQASYQPQGCPPGGFPGMGIPPQVGQMTQVRFAGPEGMVIGWQVGGAFLDDQLVAPARYSFMQGAAYRLKLGNIPGREGLVLYPTLQVYPANPVTAGYLSHSNVPLLVTEEDLDQVESNNFVTKVIYLPDPRFQELAIAGVEELVSTRLDPGIDPVAEADRRGSIMAVLRIGNVDMEMPGMPSARRDDGVRQTAYQGKSGEGDTMATPPTPIGPAGALTEGVPGAMIVGGSGYPGRPAPGPVAGTTIPAWGMPTTGTPIGLTGPAHLPFGGPASLKSHTVRNLTKQKLPDPVDHFLIDVKHDPGLSLPAPVKRIQYEESHPSYSAGEVLYPGPAVSPGR